MEPPPQKKSRVYSLSEVKSEVLALTRLQGHSFFFGGGLKQPHNFPNQENVWLNASEWNTLESVWQEPYDSTNRPINKKHLLGSRGRQLHDADGVVGPAALVVELNVTGQSVDADL